MSHLLQTVIGLILKDIAANKNYIFVFKGLLPLIYHNHIFQAIIWKWKYRIGGSTVETKEEKQDILLRKVLLLKVILYQPDPPQLFPDISQLQ